MTFSVQNISVRQDTGDVDCIEWTHTDSNGFAAGRFFLAAGDLPSLGATGFFRGDILL